MKQTIKQTVIDVTAKKIFIRFDLTASPFAEQLAARNLTRIDQELAINWMRQRIEHARR